MTEQSPEMLILLEVRNDTGPFEHLGSSFKCNSSLWRGKAVASPIAFYLLKSARNHHSHGGGLVGALLASALAKDDGLSTCTAADLPAPARAVLDPKQKLSSKEVIIIPKPTVSLVKAPRMNNVITIRAGADKFAISTNLFRIFAKPRALAAMGWTLNTALTPTAAPVHDTRTEAERAASVKPLWKKILLIAAAILILIAVIALRIATEH